MWIKSSEGFFPLSLSVVGGNAGSKTVNSTRRGRFRCSKRESVPPQEEEKIPAWEGVGLLKLGWKAVLVGDIEKPKQGMWWWCGVGSEVVKVWEGPVEGEGPSRSSSLKQLQLCA